MIRREWIAYFSMEIAVDPHVPTYSGGLGVLAGDTLRAAADLGLPVVVVTLLHRKGYFRQKLDGHGNQTEEPVEWKVEDYLEEMKQRVAITLEGRNVYLRSWRYQITGVNGFKVPVFFLDSDLSENSPADRQLTHYLYGQDQHYRLSQEVIFGIGGIRMLRVLGYNSVRKFHMNEGHAAFLAFELIEEQRVQKSKAALDQADLEDVRARCVFTTHTPVPAGHDQFPFDLVHQVAGDTATNQMKSFFGFDQSLNMTTLALKASGYVNGVSQKHAEVTRRMFPNIEIHAITNGVHAATWVVQPFQELFDRYLPHWRQDNSRLRFAFSIPKPEIWQTHLKTKQDLMERVKASTGVVFDPEVLTLGFARRVTGYKRADLIFHDPARLEKIAHAGNPLQIVFSGKAHPRDHHGKDLIRKIFQAKERFQESIKVAYLENYDMELGKLMTSGVDVWLNNPEPPLEASGTSGMKAALNGVPSLSILDGWWTEGFVQGITGWAIGTDRSEHSSSHDEDARLLYDQLEQQVLPLFTKEREHFIGMMRCAIALNGSFFNTERMMKDYITQAYF